MLNKDKIREIKLFIRFLKEEGIYTSKIMKNITFNKFNDDDDNVRWLYLMPIYENGISLSLYRRYLIFLYKNNFHIIYQLIFKNYIESAFFYLPINSTKPKELIELKEIYKKLYGENSIPNVYL